MNFRAWFFIFFVYVAYLLIGGLTFQVIQLFNVYQDRPFWAVILIESYGFKAIECDESEIAKPKGKPNCDGSCEHPQISSSCWLHLRPAQDLFRLLLQQNEGQAQRNDKHDPSRLRPVEPLQLGLLLIHLHDHHR